MSKSKCSKEVVLFNQSVGRANTASTTPKPSHKKPFSQTIWPSCPEERRDRLTPHAHLGSIETVENSAKKWMIVVPSQRLCGSFRVEILVYEQKERCLSLPSLSPHPATQTKFREQRCTSNLLACSTCCFMTS